MTSQQPQKINCSSPKKWRLRLMFLFLSLGVFPINGAPMKTADPTESTVPPERYREIRKPEWVHGCNDSAHPSAQTEYHCMKIAAPLKIDGKLNEWSWRTAPEIHFCGYVDKTEPPFPTWAKALWDDQYLYLGFHFEEPDIRAYWAFTPANAQNGYFGPQGTLYPKQYYVNDAGGPMRRSPESRIMTFDRFAKIFLDPDGDGIHYLEAHINPLGNLYTVWFDLPLLGCPDRGIHRTGENRIDLLYAMPGIKHAVYMDGTINNPNDIDNGWTVEVALPWEMLKKFSVKKRAPLPGEAWGLHLGRVYRGQIDADREYWGWPFMEVCNSHQTEKYGKLRFVDHSGFKSFFSMDLSPKPEEIVLAARMGVRQAAVPADYPESSRKCAASNGIRLFPVVSMMDWSKSAGDQPVWQKLSPAQERFFAAQEGRDIDRADPFHAVRTRGFRDTYGYRYGFAPGCLRARNIETFAARVLCPSSPENRKAIKKRIKAVCGRKENAGIFLDGIGWQNYIDCKCSHCSSVKNKSSIWINFINEMADYAKSLRSDAVVAVHLFPGTALSVQDADSCHADFIVTNLAWYDSRDLWDIRKQAKNLGKKGGKVVPAIAIGDMTTDLNILVKSPERIELELNAIARGGCGILAVKGIDCLLRHPELYQVFSRYCKP